MPVLVPKHQRVSSQSDPSGTKKEKCVYGYELLQGTDYASLIATTGAWNIVYFQAADGSLKQARWYGSWTVTEIIPAGKAARNTPLAAVMWGPQNTFRLYYLSPEYELREYCWDSNDSKYDGALNQQRVKVAPYSKLSAIVWTGVNLRVYYQDPNNRIQEYSYQGKQGWSKGASLPGDALPGTSLAYVNRRKFDEPNPSIRGYFQTLDGGLAEHVCDSANWTIGEFLHDEATFLTPITATVSMENNSPKIFVYWLSVNETILQSTNHRSWSKPEQIDTVSVAEGSKFSATSFTRDDGSVDVRVYATNSLNILSERIYRYGKWEKEQPAITVGKEVILEVIGA
ncbi:hypothetical protein ABW19_dt0205381 [Dactylella cylindrospora]|nr:hypothetical protein ABW19_dt0205381 [Dactylella cylindrospora]